MGHLTAAQLQRLEHHKYSCINRSIVEPYLIPWWDWLVEQCPLTLAPSLITITGLIINIVTSLILCYYSPDAKQEVPRWASFLAALGFFIYQSLDGVDGKQARRTGTASPLGELFDHGCDSLSILIVPLGTCCSVRLGTMPYWMFLLAMLVMTLLYCSHWQNYVTGTMRFGYVDLIEAELAVMVILTISGLFGPEFRFFKVPVLSLPVMCITMPLLLVAAGVMLYNYFTKILGQRGAGRSGSTVAGTSVLSPVVPLISILASAVFIAWKSPEDVYLQNPIIYLFTFGCVLARASNRLMVARITKSAMACSDSSLLGPGALLLNQYFNCPIPEKTLLYAVCAYVVYDLIKYCREVCLEISQHLNIRVFSIVPQHSSVSGHGSVSEKDSSSSSLKYMTSNKSKIKRN